MPSFVLTVVGDDRPGLVSALASTIQELGGSWERSQMARLSGKFAGVVLVAMAQARLGDLEAELLALDPALKVSIEPTNDVVVEDVATMRLDLLGADRPGIMAEVSSRVAAQRISIEELTTTVRDAPMAGGTLFEAHALLRAGANVDTQALRSSLEGLADELMVDISLETE